MCYDFYSVLTGIVVYSTFIKTFNLILIIIIITKKIISKKNYLNLC